MLFGQCNIAWIESETHRLLGMLQADAGATLPMGGTLIDDVFGNFPSWDGPAWCTNSCTPSKPTCRSHAPWLCLPRFAMPVQLPRSCRSSAWCLSSCIQPAGRQQARVPKVVSQHDLAIVA